MSTRLLNFQRADDNLNFSLIVQYDITHAEEEAFESMSCLSIRLFVYILFIFSVVLGAY